MSYREYIPTERSTSTSVFGKRWIVEAGWAHPLWHSYAVILLDLTTEIQGSPAIIYRDGMTHEVHVFALDPDKPVEPPVHILHPANHCYQRAGSVCLNSFGRFAKWISASIMPPPSWVPAR